jgi:hypothetical protein
MMSINEGNVKLLVYGPRKAGTTVTQRLVDNEKMLCHSAETKIKSYVKLQEKLKSKESINENELIYFFQGSKVERLNPSQLYWINDKLNSIKSLQDYILASLEFCYVFRVSASFSIKGDDFSIKEVGGNPRIVISSFLDAFPDGSVLQVLRDPRYVSSAIFRNRRDRGIRLSPHKVFRETLEAFSVTAEIIRQDMIRRSDPSFHTCIYENLTEDPKAFVRKVRELYSLPITPEAIPTQFGDNVPVKTASNKKAAGEVFKSNNAWYRKLSGLEIIIVVIVSIRFSKTLIKLNKLKKRASSGFVVD